MKHVIAFDVSMGKSYVVVYNALKTCMVEKNPAHMHRFHRAEVAE